MSNCESFNLCTNRGRGYQWWWSWSSWWERGLKRERAKKVEIYGFVPHQVTKDKMLAEKDEELRRMQEMLAQMQVMRKIFWTLMDVQFSKLHLYPTFHIWIQFSKQYLYPRLKPR